MKITVLNYPGTVGKTTIAVNMLCPRMENVDFIAVESFNESAESLGVDVTKITGVRFREVYTRLLKTENAIVDVGASNIEGFLDGMAKFEDSHLEIDYFLIPVTCGSKEQTETLIMFQTLINYGIDPSCIKIVFNRVQDSVIEEFDILYKYSKHNPAFPMEPKAAIIENTLFNLMGQKKTSLPAVLADETDYKAQIRLLNKETDFKLINQMVDAHTMRSLAKTVDKNLTQVYETLFGGQI